MTISRIITSTFMLMAAFAVVAFALSVASSMRDYSQISRQASLSEATTAWMGGTVNLSFERSVTQVALALDEPIPSNLRQLIDQQRSASDELFDQSIALVEGYAFLPTQNAFLSGVRQARATVRQLRAEIDALLAAPGAQRDAGRVYDLPFELKSEIAEMKNLVEFLTIENAALSQTSIALASVRNRAWEVREFGGRARTYYAVATLTKTAISEGDRATLFADSDRAEKAWGVVDAAVRTLDLGPDLTVQIAEAGDTYFNGYVPLLADLDAAMAAQSEAQSIDYPVSFEEFFNISNEALDNMAALSKAAGIASGQYWEGRKADALITLLVCAAATLLLAATLIGATTWIRRRVVLRVQAATTALVDVANGDLDAEVSRRDSDPAEIASLIEALDSFRTSLVAARATKAEAAEARRAARTQMMADMQASFGAVVERAVQRDFSARVSEAIDDPELTRLAEGTNKLLGSVEAALEATSGTMQRVAQGNLQHRLEGDFKGPFRALQENVNGTIDRLSDLVAEITETTGSIQSDGMQITKGASALSARAEQQASALEETSAAMQQLSGAVASNAQSSTDARKVATDASERAKSGGEIVENAVAAMSRIEASATKIADITSVIDGIASQTNLLALNAAVEAARAGEAGKGFAVVASEVRSLAQRSSEAAQDIRALIETSATQVAEGVDLVSQTGSSLDGIRRSIVEVERAVENIASATSEQSTGISEISTAISDMDEMTQQNATMADQSASSAQTLSASARRLEDLIAFFEISGRTDTSRAA